MRTLKSMLYYCTKSHYPITDYISVFCQICYVSHCRMPPTTLTYRTLNVPLQLDMTCSCFALTQVNSSCPHPLDATDCFTLSIMFMEIISITSLGIIAINIRYAQWYNVIQEYFYIQMVQKGRCNINSYAIMSSGLVVSFSCHPVCQQLPTSIDII